MIHIKKLTLLFTRILYIRQTENQRTINCSIIASESTRGSRHSLCPLPSAFPIYIYAYAVAMHYLCVCIFLRVTKYVWFFVCCIWMLDTAICHQIEFSVKYMPRSTRRINFPSSMRHETSLWEMLFCVALRSNALGI